MGKFKKQAIVKGLLKKTKLNNAAFTFFETTLCTKITKCFHVPKFQFSDQCDFPYLRHLDQGWTEGRTDRHTDKFLKTFLKFV